MPEDDIHSSHITAPSDGGMAAGWGPPKDEPSPTDREALGAGRLARAGGVVVPSTLAALAALHAAWALGWRRPGGSDRELAKRVLSRGERERLLAKRGRELPSPLATSVVAAGLAGAALVVDAASRGTRSRAVRFATWGLSGVFAARAAAGVSTDLVGGLDELYKRLDLVIYSPLCLALAATTAAVARHSAVTADRTK